MSISELPHATDSDFDRTVLADPSPVLVEFFAAWCGHCRKMAPAIAGIAADRAGHLRVVQVNAPENMATASRFGVRGVPTFILFAGGEEVDRIVGEVPRQTLDAHIERAVASPVPG